MRVGPGKTKLMVRGIEEETFDSKTDPCGIRVEQELCTACGKWLHARSTDEKITIYLAKDFVCKKGGRYGKEFERTK